MKLIYKKPLIFPSWAVFKSKHAGRKYYVPKENGITFSGFDMLPYFNHIEMTGFEASSIISYKIDKGRRLRLYAFCVFPQIRVIPNETRGSLTYRFKSVEAGINGCEKTVCRVDFDGRLIIEEKAGNVLFTHTFYPAYDKKALIEKTEIKNGAESEMQITVKNKRPQACIKKRYLVDSSDRMLYTSVFCGGREIAPPVSEITVKPLEAITLTAVYGADRLNAVQADGQIEKRERFLSEMKSRLKITTPDEDINRMLEFCKIRACESIFETKNGLMHAPGGGNFYGALWTNDQCEYANPLFAYLGYEPAKRQSINCYTLYSRLASEEKAIPTSIIACGDGLWNGAGDRGDSSMFLYGLSRYLLTAGDKETAEKFLPSVEAALKYVISNITDDGIVKSDSDELENRFESGRANLSTSCITYDAFISLNYLFKELGRHEQAERLLSLAEKIRLGTENYFGAEVEGFNTYRYCAEENRLRSWICLPLTVGINDRKSETVNALFSDKLYKNGAILTRSGEKTYWDRSALYALRGLFYSGEANRAADMLAAYTEERLYGCHPPYPVEAFPEGNSAQLSAESALYLRIFTEGILGYRPTGFDSFEIKPSLPDGWKNFKIENIELGGNKVNISVTNSDDYTVIINNTEAKIKKGKKCTFKADKTGGIYEIHN